MPGFPSIRQDMEIAPYFVGFAVICLIVSIGLQYRTTWMWYLGWVFFYIFAGYIGFLYFTAFYYAGVPGYTSSAFLYLFGGMVLWVPATIWWATRRHLFGPRKRLAAASRNDNATLKPTKADE